MRWQNIHRISPHRRRKPIALTVFLLAVTVLARPAAAQTISMFANADKDWTRIGVPPTHPVSDVGQWHIDAAKRTIICDGNGGHEWLRFNRELGDFEFRVKWRFTPVPNNTGYNSGVFFRNNEDGSIWHQAQTTLAGGYLFGVTPIDGKPTSFNLQKEMKKNRLKPAGNWNLYEIRCMGEVCTLAVNGEVVNTSRTGITKGYVGLESEGYQITFKDLKLRELK